MNTFKNLIGGQWVDAADGAVFEDRNPAHPDRVIGTFPNATRQDVQNAIDNAREALHDWARTPAPERGAILYRASHLVDARLADMAAALTEEEGKTLAESRGEVARARDILRYYAGEGWRMGGDVLPGNVEGQLLYTRREPLGVVSIITPWNYPVAIPAWKIAPALAYGNAVVFKPASYAPRVGLMLVEELVRAGIPPGVLNYVTGPGSIVGKEMVRNSYVDGISFTGSYAVGVGIYREGAENMSRVQVEMGGKNPLVVLRDADLELAVDLAVRGGYGVTGQACTATSRVIVEEAIADAFAGALAEAARSLVVGDGLDSGTQMGPAVSEEQRETDLSYIEIGREQGAQLLAGGKPLPGPGFFLQPTLFDRVQPEMRIAQEEIFGPVIGILRVLDFDEALQQANATGYGLSASIVTNDLHRALAFADRIQAGVVKVNDTTTGLALQAPFGGFKHSSGHTFKEQGRSAIEFYTRIKTVYVTHGRAWRDIGERPER
jgi:acyl-CoA reductase-like NAD-dependent aldehyde dehydrogenase